MLVPTMYMYRTLWFFSTYDIYIIRLLSIELNSVFTFFDFKNHLSELRGVSRYPYKESVFSIVL